MDHAVIDRFRVSEAAGYSQYWRRNKSPVEAFELARLLLGLRKVVSLVGRNVGTLVWSGMKAKDELALDPSLVLGAYPVPPAKVDRVTGLAIRLAFGRIEWSLRLQKMALLSKPEHPKNAAQFEFYLDICERVYLDNLSNQSPFGLYTEAQRLRAIQEALGDAIAPPTISELLNLWWAMAAERDGQHHAKKFFDHAIRKAFPRVNLETLYRKPLEILNSMVDALIHECPRISGITERCEFRLKLYLSAWTRLFEVIKFWPIDERDAFPAPQLNDEDDLDIELEEDEERGISFVIPDLIQRATFRTLPGFTDEVRQVVQNKDEVVPIRGNDFIMPAPNRIDKKILHHLTIIFQSVAERSALVNRGQKTGKIDRRRLYRAQTDGTIFKLTRTDYLLRSNIVVLVDSTGSMATPHKWENLEMVYQTLFAAIHKFNKHARLLAYNEKEGTCLLSEIFLDEKFYNVLPRGKTASGEAIIATARSLKTFYKKSYLIHVTDGASNWGCGVQDAISLCRKEGINLLTLGISCNEISKISLRNEYGRLVAFVERNDDLPHLMNNLLRYSQWK